jgi:DNA modification methylase
VDNSIKALKNIDWDFSDYSSSKYPIDINSMHWYPGSFVPQIPSVLIEVLSKPGDRVLDIFSGSGTTLIEASRLNRKYIGIDSNPNAIDISKAKIYAISRTKPKWYTDQIQKISSVKPIRNLTEYCVTHGINSEVQNWFEETTLAELLSIHKYLQMETIDYKFLILKNIFSSILNKCCSQREHYTYITDNCRPPDMLYRPAIKGYIEQLRLIGAAIKFVQEQYKRIHNKVWNPIQDGRVEFGDSRDLNTIDENEADIVVTSPPYLGVNDYVRSMKLTYLFFNDSREKKSISNEIGARRKRQRKNAFEEYIQDMKESFHEISRVLKPDSYFCMIIGQGRGKVNKTGTIKILLDILIKNYEFSLLFEKNRKIKFRRIQVPGVSEESIIVLKKNKDSK